MSISSPSSLRTDIQVGYWSRATITTDITSVVPSATIATEIDSYQSRASIAMEFSFPRYLLIDEAGNALLIDEAGNKLLIS